MLTACFHHFAVLFGAAYVLLGLLQKDNLTGAQISSSEHFKL
jgi:hypothetical protein